MITPIILIGMNRSGTKWASNILCTHEEVIGVQSDSHGGILETNLFGAMQDKFDLSNPDEYVGFLEMWAKTDFFGITGVDKNMFYRLNPRPRQFMQIFELLMREFASRNGKSYWLQKTSPSRAAEVLRYFDNARIVAVRRNLIDTLRSTLALQAQRGRRRLIRSTFSYVRERKTLKSLVRNYSVVEVDYDTLRSQSATEIERICAELDLDPKGLESNVTFRKNTSFSNTSQRAKVLSKKDELLIRLSAGVFSLIPLRLMTLAAIIKARLWCRRPPSSLVAGSYRSLTANLEDRSMGDG